MCASCSSSPLRAFLRACSVIFANASQAARFSTRSSGRRDAEEGGNGRGKQDGKGRGFDSPVVSRFFLHPGSHRIKQLSFFFFQLFNDERASRRRCCLSSAAHKSCAKLARRTPSAFYFLSPPSMYDSTRHDTWGNLERRP